MAKVVAQNTDSFNPYVAMIRLGRALENHSFASEFATQYPQDVLQYMTAIENSLRFRPIDEFLSVFPLRKRYANDGRWDYYSARKMIQTELGSHFGKSDFVTLVMCDCFENPYVALVGFTFMVAIGELHRKRTRLSMAGELFR